MIAPALSHLRRGLDSLHNHTALTGPDLPEVRLPVTTSGRDPLVRPGATAIARLPMTKMLPNGFATVGIRPGQKLAVRYPVLRADVQLNG
ncbi:MAG: hypothetical protein ACREQ3_24915 [Candidatus Binatia bacterium]